VIRFLASREALGRVAAPAAAQPADRCYAGDAVGNQPGPALVAMEGRPRQRAEDAVDRSSRDLTASEQILQSGHVPSDLRNAKKPAAEPVARKGPERGQRATAGDAVDDEPFVVLEAADGPAVCGPKIPSIDPA
jgi:hypothetical protein